MMTFSTFVYLIGMILLALISIWMIIILVAGKITKSRMRETEVFTAECGHETQLEGTLQPLGKGKLPVLLLLNEKGRPTYCMECLQKAMPDYDDGLFSINKGNPVAVSIEPQ